jgi:DnaJ-domain-containing protein 1
MFERTRTDNRLEPVALPVELEMTDGTSRKGKLKISSHHQPLEALNAPGGFLEFEPYGGELAFIAKSMVAAIRPVNVPRAPQLRPRGGQSDAFDPHEVLGISSESTWEETRAAYVRLSKLYHPDLFTSTALPPEVSAYLEATVRRINAAYAALDQVAKVVKVRRGTTSEPIFSR